jgi:hypothetical protein
MAPVGDFRPRLKIGGFKMLDVLKFQAENWIKAQGGCIKAILVSSQSIEDPFTRYKRV